MGGRIGHKGAVRAAIASAAFAAAGVTAWACADTREPPRWELAKDYYDSGGNGAVLTPGNDTRVNLLLLLADRHGVPVRHAAAAAPEGPPLALFDWKGMAQAAQPPEPAQAAEPDYWGGTRCQSNAAGAAAFVTALRANPAVPEEEKQRLVAARTAFAPTCSSDPAAAPAVAASSAAGRAFAIYMAGAAHFYGERFDAAEAAFDSLRDAPDPWLRETAHYMLARNALNRAQQASHDEYGWLADPEQRDRAGIAAAGKAFEAYLAGWPEGRYAASARGLTRRVAWLADDGAALAAAFDRQLEKAAAPDGAAGAVALVQEIDRALIETDNGSAARNPLLLAVADLQRMRCHDDWETPGEDCGTRLTRQELERQAPLFADEPALYGYLRAAEAFFVRQQPREVLSLIPDAAHQPRFTYTEFSRQMLRGMALEAVRDRNARAFWLTLFPGAVQPYQREAVELALALHEQRSGRVDRVFAADSKVRHPVMRQLLLEHVAGPDLLRRQAQNSTAPKQERDVATYMLLAKELQRGFYREFLDDVRLLPANLPEEYHHSGAASYDPTAPGELPPPPLRHFAPGANVGDTGCPALLATVEQLAARPQAAGPRLCLAEFFRVNGFDWFGMDEPVSGNGLGSAPSQFPGKPYQRLEVYKAVIADPAATADQRALALNRAIRCYQPTGTNSCGGREVALEQRSAWFQRLKRDHPGSRWARTLRYYW